MAKQRTRTPSPFIEFAGHTFIVLNFRAWQKRPKPQRLTLFRLTPKEVALLNTTPTNADPHEQFGVLLPKVEARLVRERRKWLAPDSISTSPVKMPSAKR